MNQVNITEMDTKTDCIVATYRASSVFKIPKSINPIDIVDYYVKYDTLYLTMKDGTDIAIEPEWHAEIDFHDPDELAIEDKDDYCCETDDEEEEDEDEKTQ